MKLVILACLLAAVAAAPPRYTDRYDSVNLDEILANARLRVPYIKCLLGQGKCSPDGRELKLHVQEALENNCGQCTSAQRTGTRRVIAHLINREPAYWRQLTAKYDPQRKYVTKYEDDLKSVGAR